MSQVFERAFTQFVCGYLIVLLLSACMLGCSDRATIGGLCLEGCAAAGCGGQRCAAPAGGGGGCSGAGCAVDAGYDACAAVSCSADAGSACRDGSYELTRTRLDLMLVVDNTASLYPWWFALYEGLTKFLQDPASSGVGVGLQRFDEVCEALHYVQPLVPIAPLPGNWTALDQALMLPGTASSSTVPAFDGALQYARSWATTNSEAQVAVVLLTDAAPGACDGLTGNIEGELQRIARGGYEGTPSIKTYVIGFSVLATTDAIAVAGGTTPVLISVAPADGEVRTALDNVRNEAWPCVFRLPSGWTLAPGSEVVVSALDGSERRHPIVDSSSACGQQDGFFVADPASPYALTACERTCGGLAATDRLALPRACVGP